MPHLRCARDFACRGRGEMRALLCECDIDTGEGRFDEQNVGALDEPDDLATIVRRIGNVGDVADLLARRHAIDAAQAADLHFTLAVAPGPIADHQLKIIRYIVDDGPFEVVQPGSDRQAKSGKLGLPNIDMDHFLDREAEARRAVIERRGAKAKARPLQYEAILAKALARLLRFERMFQAEGDVSRRKGRPHLGDDENQIAGIGRGEIPFIAVKFVEDAIGKVGRAKEMEALFSANQDSQDTVEAEDVINVGVRDENMLDPVDLPRRERIDAAEIAEHDLSFEQRLKQQHWVPEPTIQKGWM